VADNERTVDGKGTTHAMTSLLVSGKSEEVKLISRLPRTGKRTFDSKTLPGGSLCSVIPYNKPTHRPCPLFDPPVILQEISIEACTTCTYEGIAVCIWTLCSLFKGISEAPFTHWDIFQSETCHCDTSVSSIAYNPIIMANPTDYSTVYTTLLPTKEVMSALGQSYVPIVFDMCLLVKALEIVWSRCDELKGVIPVEGGMHRLMSVFAGIGYLYGDAGLRHLLT